MSKQRSGGGTGPDRLPPLAPGTLSPAQQAAAARFEQLRGTPVFGPFWPLIRSPELLSRAQELGFYLRYNSALPLELSEMAILMIARLWDQPVEWEIHQPAALKAGLPLGVAQAIGEGRLPDLMSPQQAAVHDVLEQLHRTRSVDDAVYASAVALLGEAGLMDLIGIAGYYTLLAMAMNLSRTPTSGDDTPPMAGT